ncbi:hypothetical protein [Streptomyces sp. 147326]|uniref:hypothetical protein n=1 Tax=Streptomyces sp. 147326 TaxID=3074379 RepID=UPI0038574FAC
MAAVVLVHGLYHRPEHFVVLAERLRTAGTEVVVPELDRGSLSADTAAVQARAIDPGLQRRMASRCTDVREWQSGHSPFVGQPDLIVELVLEVLATRTPHRRSCPTRPIRRRRPGLGAG